jgi:AcrR family transcriptional regulator
MTPTHLQPRSDNRREQVLEAAADLFVEKGYHGTSMRDIARFTGMLPGSLYYHFPSKEALLTSVFEEGVLRISDKVDKALESAEAEPWTRLQLACEAHLKMLLGGSSFAQVVVRVLPNDAPDAESSLVEMRDSYEARFRDLVAKLPLKTGSDRKIFRLMLMGAMNHAPVWFKHNGATAKELAEQFIGNLQAAHSDKHQKSSTDNHKE